MWTSHPTRCMVTLSIIVIDSLIKLTKVALTRVFITSAWLKLDESTKWKQGFIETMLQLHMLHLGDLDTQFAHSIRTVGCGGPRQAPAEHMSVLEGLLRKLFVDSETLFIQDFQVRGSPYRVGFLVGLQRAGVRRTCATLVFKMAMDSAVEGLSCTNLSKQAPHPDLAGCSTRAHPNPSSLTPLWRLQCTVAALREVDAEASLAERAQMPLLSRTLYLTAEAIGKLRLRDYIAAGTSGIQATSDPRMSYSDEAQQFLPAAISAGGPLAQQYSSALAQRNKCATILEEWKALCDADGGGPSSEQTVRSCGHSHALRSFCCFAMKDPLGSAIGCTAAALPCLAPRCRAQTVRPLAGGQMRSAMAPSTACTTAVQSQFINNLASQLLLEENTFQMVVRISLDMLIAHATQLACLEDPSPHTLLSDAFLQLLGAIAVRHERPITVVRAVCTAARSVIADVAKRRKSALLPRPIHRILLGILHELPLATEAVPWEYGLVLFAHVLLEVQPLKIPGLAFVSLELLAHRKFMVPLLKVHLSCPLALSALIGSDSCSILVRAACAPGRVDALHTVCD
jgi:hypothetical protein